MRFRRNLERLGEIFAYEISKKISYKQQNIVTPLGELDMPVVECWPVLATILRAGLPFHQGFLNIFDKSESAFISAYRKHHKDGSFTIQVEYASCPNLDDKTLIVIDPMLATGSSLVLSIKELFQFGMPKNIHIAATIVRSRGLTMLENICIIKNRLWGCAIDEELPSSIYIVPGLGDAGDLSFGNKIIKIFNLFFIEIFIVYFVPK